MFLNVSKCNVITFSKKKSIIDSEYCIENEPLKRVTTINDLGIMMDMKVNFNNHIDIMTNNCHRTLAFIKRRAKEFSDPYVTKTLYCSLVRSKIEYVSVVWNMVGTVNSAKIESVQKQFLLFALRNLGWSTNTFVLPAYESRLKLLNMETLEARRKNNDILFAYDLIKKRIKCNELCSKIIFNEPAPQNLRRRRLLHVDLRRRDYTCLEPLNRVATRFNEISHLFDEDITRKSFLKKLRNQI